MIDLDWKYFQTVQESTIEKYKNKWLESVDEEGVITFPEEVLKQLGWYEGIELDCIPQKDGSILIKAVGNTNEKEVQGPPEETVVA
jgi:bifunctional DNA-binding transcriptional regulator/antitoxin component of YhaV-PrlF toxin-antitoxin module